MTVNMYSQKQANPWHLGGVFAVFASLGLPSTQAIAQEPVRLVLDEYQPECGIDIVQEGGTIRVAWPAGEGRTAEMAFSLGDEAPLIEKVSIGAEGDSAKQTIATGLDPVLLLRVGKRDLAKREGWTIFFDRMQEKPHAVYEAELERTHAKASSNENRCTLTIGELTVGPFAGAMRWTFFSGSPFVLQEAVVSTSDNGVAYLYDTGLVCRDALPSAMTWNDTEWNRIVRSVSQFEASENLAVHGRAVCGEFGIGSLAVFPPPHRYFYPLDFSNNLKNIWVGPGYADRSWPFGFGIRHDPRGDNRFVPWFNAPPGTEQQLGRFLLVSDEGPGKCLDG